MLCGALFLCFSLASLPAAVALLVNRTIDDENGDSVTGAKPVYVPDVDPTGNWIQGRNCVRCTMLPGKVVDISRTFDGTWHDSTYHPGNPDHTIDAQFSGTAVYVYFIIPNYIQYTTTFVNLSFTVDGTYYNQYQHAPDNSSSTIMYNVLVFHTTSLVNTAHKIQVRAGGSSASMLLFDYMVYTIEVADPSPSLSDFATSSLRFSSSTSRLPGESLSSSASPLGTPPPVISSPDIPSPAQGSRSAVSIGAIVGGVSGAAALLSVVLLLIMCRCRRREQHCSFAVPRWFATRTKKPQSLHTTSSIDLLTSSPQSEAHWHTPFLSENASKPARLSHITVRRHSEPNSTLDSLAPAPATSVLLPGPTRLAKDIAREPEGAVVRSQSVDRSISTHTGSVRPGKSALRAQITTMQEELERLRAEREVHALYVEPPPRYQK